MKQQRVIITIIGYLFMMNSTLFAQNGYGWHSEFVGNINVTQTSFENWGQGGENTLAWQFGLNAKSANDREGYNWSNKGKFAFGKVKIGDGESMKSTDEMRLESVFTYKIGKYFNPYMAMKGETQFTTGFEYTDTSKTAISDFMDPGYFTQSIGASYTPSDELVTRMGFALREIITQDYPVPYADDPETPRIEKTKIEIGMESITDFSKKFGETILLTTQLELFSNLEGFDEIDARWDNVFSVQVSKYIDVSLNVTLFYDKDISEKLQLRQTLGLGLTYSLF